MWLFPGCKEGFSSPVFVVQTSAFPLAPQAVVCKTRLLWPSPKVILSKSKVEQLKVSGSKACTAFSLGRWLWLNFELAPFLLFFLFLPFNWDLSLKASLINQWKATLISCWKLHWSVCCRESSFPVYHVPCRRESSFLRSLRPHLSNEGAPE